MGCLPSQAFEAGKSLYLKIARPWSNKWGPLHGDWSGDFEFDSSDFVVTFTAGAYESVFADVDGDGQYDFLPIWVDQSTIDPLTFDGLVSWYQPNWADPTV